MLIFYDQDGNVVGTVNGFGKHGVTDMKIGEQSFAQHDIPLGHPDEPIARRLMDPRDPLTTQDVKVDGGVRELTDKEKKTKKSAEAKADKTRENPPRRDSSSPGSRIP